MSAFVGYEGSLFDRLNQELPIFGLPDNEFGVRPAFWLNIDKI
jgi:hypothetical protein